LRSKRGVKDDERLQKVVRSDHARESVHSLPIIVSAAKSSPFITSLKRKEEIKARISSAKVNWFCHVIDVRLAQNNFAKFLPLFFPFLLRAAT
jgi:hypothetical protein